MFKNRRNPKRICGNCHARLRAGDKYCSTCGTKVGDGAYEPNQVPQGFVQQCIYGPMPVYREHRCKGCDFTWTTYFMVDDEKYCPRCGGEAPYKEVPNNEMVQYIQLTDKDDPNLVWSCRINKEILIGRDEEADIRFVSGFDIYIARRQCRIIRSNNSYFIVDPGSTNRTYLNGVVLKYNTPYSIKAGDEIKIGRHTFMYDQGEMNNAEP